MHPNAEIWSAKAEDLADQSQKFADETKQLSEGLKAGQISLNAFTLPTFAQNLRNQAVLLLDLIKEGT